MKCSFWLGMGDKELCGKWLESLGSFADQDARVIGSRHRTRFKRFRKIARAWAIEPVRVIRVVRLWWRLGASLKKRHPSRRDSGFALPARLTARFPRPPPSLPAPPNPPSPRAPFPGSGQTAILLCCPPFFELNISISQNTYFKRKALTKKT